MSVQLPNNYHFVAGMDVNIHSAKKELLLHFYILHMEVKKFKMLLHLKKKRLDRSGKTPIMGRITHVLLIIRPVPLA
jgi:hypothetical protein